MAFKQSFATLVLTLCVALAEDTTTTSPSSNSEAPSSSTQNLPNFFSNFPFSIPGMPNMGSGFPHLPGMPNMGSGSSGFPALPNIPGIPNIFGGRSRRDVKPNDSENHDGEEHGVHGPDGHQIGEHDPQHEHQDRFFFSTFPVFIGCNYTANPGRSCPSCNQALTCTSSNVGILQTCRGLFRFCNNGRCSLNKGSACDATTTTSSTSTSTTSSTTTMSTSTQATTQAAG